MTVPERIDQIIATRQKQAERVKQTVEHLGNVRQTMLDFQAMRNVVAQSGNDELTGKLNTIVVDRFITDCDNVMEELGRLQKRFSRDHIHMSFVGRARQGKSLVMQQISGLEGDIIPSADGGHCTGAKSIITNSDAEDVVADIHFYRADEVVTIVNEYLTEIFGKNEPLIRQVADIPSLSKRNLQDRLDPKNATANSHWEHLQKFIEHIGEFESYLGVGERKTIQVSSDEIESYVAQYKNSNPDVLYYKYLGVKEANIHCRFPSYETCGKVVLVDTIGLGDTSIGVEDEMIRAIREDSDAIIYMFRPDVKGPIIDADHYKIIEDISEKVSVEYARNMLFWVVNRDMSSGEQKGRQISSLAKKIEDAREHNAVPICQVLDVNCMDANEVQERLLTPVLKQMSDNLETIDSLLIERVQTQLNRLYEVFQVLSNQIQGAYSKTVSQDVRRKFEDKIDSTINRWTKDLNTLCRARKGQRDIDNARFSGDFQSKLKLVFTRLPSPEVIENYLNRLGGKYTQHELYIRITQYLRVLIINDFLTLDRTLDELVHDLKLDIVHILANEDKGRLCYVVPFSDDDNPDEWLDNMVQVADSGGYDSISEALRSLRNFTMSVTGFFIYPVRNGLDPIDAALQEKLPAIEGYPDEKAMAKSIYGWIKRYIFQVRSKIEEDCRGYLSFPNSALYAAARDFWDRSSFSVPSLEKESAEVQRKWQHFYEDHIAEIWSEECNQYTAAYRMNEDFGNLVKALKDCNRKNYFQV